MPVPLSQMWTVASYVLRNKLAGVKIREVPYKGAADALDFKLDQLFAIK